MSYIITISRVNASGAKKMSEDLAAELNLPIYDTDDLKPEGKELSYPELFEYHTKVLNEIADRDESCIVIGRVGDAILKNRSNVVRFGFRVPYEKSIEVCMTTKNHTYEEAVEIVNNSNTERDAYYYAVFNKHWEHEVEFDLCINSCAMDWGKCVELMKHYITLKLGVEL